MSRFKHEKQVVGWAAEWGFLPGIVVVSILTRAGYFFADS